MGVEPDRSGIASFQVMFSVVDQRTGRPVSALVPFSWGPRHCGQSSARRSASPATAANPMHRRTGATPRLVDIRDIGSFILLGSQ